MRHLTAVFLSATVLAGPLAAQDSPEQLVGIVGFRSVEWGAQRAAVVQAEGTPLGTYPFGSSGVMLIYRDTILWHEAVTIFIVHDTLGVIAGGYRIETLFGQECERVIDKAVSQINRQYPGAEMEGGKRNESGLNFCNGVMAGQASASYKWHDTRTDAEIAVGMLSGETSVNIAYISASGADYVRKMRAQRAERVF